MIGINDLKRFKWDGKLTAEYLLEIKEDFDQRTNAKLVFISIPPVNICEPQLKVIDLFNLTIKENVLDKEFIDLELLYRGMPLIDFINHDPKEDMFIHLNERAQKMLFCCIGEKIRSIESDEKIQKLKNEEAFLCKDPQFFGIQNDFVLNRIRYR